MDFINTYQNYLNIVVEWLKTAILKENSLDSNLVNSKAAGKKILDAMEYSLMAGGKRIRPILSLAVCDMLRGDKNIVLPFAAAIELIHTYSLIHDDLPCMDNDDYRRGKLTNHKVFGEAMAVLAGDALLNLAFEIMLFETLKDRNNSYPCLKTAHMIARAAGTTGMIGGQVLDMESERREISYEELCQMHGKKTGALFTASVLSPAILLDIDETLLKQLENYAVNIGLAFQIKDDILDFEGNSEVVGKTTGSDTINKKATFVSLLGIEKAKELLYDTTKKAEEALKPIPDNEFLRQIAIFIAQRDK